MQKHPEYNDKRQEYRLASGGTVYIELDSGEGEEPSILVSHASDLSANGLQLALDKPLPVGHIYTLCVQFVRPEVHFVLAGQVKWCRAAESGYRLGVALFESDDTAIAAWKAEIARRLGEGE